MTTVLISGGLGYIGSHLVKNLSQNRFKTIVVDNLSTGRENNCDNYAASVYSTNLLNKEALRQVFLATRPEIVIHCASFSQVGESNLNPSVYYQNNLVGLMNLLDVMLEYKVNKLIFSSSAAVYGAPILEYIPEDCPHNPISVYGRTKSMMEQIIKDYGINSVILRYFNAIGNDRDIEMGETHFPETHLVPLAIKACLFPEENQLELFTSDTFNPIRDYIDVLDLVEIHKHSIEILESTKGTQIFNCGYKKGYSVTEIVKVVEKLTGKPCNCITTQPRTGDPFRLVADNAKLVSTGWFPKYDSLEDSIKSVIKFQEKNYSF